tara:strand:+ start:60 stop:3239 length:3180 start_codon:yes stop_codon:yes gene_type:complete
MSRARVDQIVNQLGTGLVEFPEGLQVSAGKTLKIGGPVEAYGGTTGTAGQILKAGSNSELVWGDSDSVTFAAGDGSNSNQKVINLTQSGVAGQQQVIFRSGSNVTLTRSVNEIIIDASYVNDDTITRLQSSSGGTLVSGDVSIAGTGATTVSQSGQVITVTSTNTTYTAGTGITLTGTEFSIPQTVATTSSPTFNALTLTTNIGAVDGTFSGNVSGTWTGGTIPIDKGGTGNTTASSAFLSLAPAVGSQPNRFLKTDGSSIFWSDLPATGGFTPKTYDLTAEAGGSSNTAKIRLTDNDGITDDITLVGQNDITVTRSGNTINFGSSFTDNNDNDYVNTATLTGTNLVIGRTGALADITVDLSTLGGGGGGGPDTDSTYDLDTQSTSGGASIRLISGGSALGSPIDEAKLIGGNNATVTREANGDITISATDTDVNTVTRLKITGPGTTGGAFATGDISLQASGSVSMVQSGNIIAISADNSNSYVDNAYYSAINGGLTIERTDSLQDINLPVSNLQAYFDTRYITSGGLADAKITSASFSSGTGNLTLTPNDGTGSIVVNLDGRYVTNTGDNHYVTSGSLPLASSNPPGFHISRPILRLGRNDGVNVDIETEPLYDYLDGLYAPITSGDTRVDAFTFTDGDLYLSVSNGDTYSYDLDARYIRHQDYIGSATFNTSSGVLTLVPTVEGSNGTQNADVTVDLDGRYKLDTAQDVAISSLQWDASAGNVKAVKNDSTQTPNCNIDGRYVDTVNFSGGTFTFGRNNGTDTTVSLPEGRIDVPTGSVMLFAQSSAPVGWVKSTSHDNKALRVSSSSGGGGGGTYGFTNMFASGRSTGGSVDSSGLSVSGNVSSGFGSGNLSHDFGVDGSPNYNWGSGGSASVSMGISGSPNVSMGNISINSGNFVANAGNLYARTMSQSISQMPYHGHNYIEGQQARRGNATDDGRAYVQSHRHMVQTGGTGSGGAHGHFIDGYGNVSGSAGISGSMDAGAGSLTAAGNISFEGNNMPALSLNKGNLDLSGGIYDNRAITSTFADGAVTGNVTFTAGTINLNVSYVDVIICVRT